MNKLTIVIFLLITLSAKAQSYKEVAVQVIAPQTQVVNSMAGKLLGKKNQVSIAFQLPKNTIRWFYIFSASRNKEDVQRIHKGCNLFANLSYIIDQTGTTKNAINVITAPPGTDFCNVYLLASYKDVTIFDKEFSTQSFSYDRVGSRDNLTQGVITVNSPGHLQGYQYLAFQNPSGMYEVSVTIEVVAIVNQQATVSGWTSTKKSEIYNILKDLLVENACGNLNSGEKISLANCGTKKITSEYTYEAINGLADHEITETLAKAMQSCIEELNLNCSGQPSANKISQNFFMGDWKDDVSYYTFENNGKFIIKFMGQPYSNYGTWKFSEDSSGPMLTIQLEQQNPNIFRVLSNIANSYTYQASGDPSKRIFTATRQ